MIHRAKKKEPLVPHFSFFEALQLMVLMDGRSMYTPAFSGVYWYIQETLLEDVDRIEVLRGPGATLWGANREPTGV